MGALVTTWSTCPPTTLALLALMLCRQRQGISGTKEARHMQQTTVCLPACSLCTCMGACRAWPALEWTSQAKGGMRLQGHHSLRLRRSPSVGGVKVRL